MFFTAATGTPPSYFTVSVGDEVTLHCGAKKDHKVNFGSTEWLFTGLRTAASQILVTELSRDIIARSDRLSVTANLSLVIKTVTVEDVGFYTCRQNVSGQQDDADYFLSVIDSKCSNLFTLKLTSEYYIISLFLHLHQCLSRRQMIKSS